VHDGADAHAGFVALDGKAFDPDAGRPAHGGSFDGNPGDLGRSRLGGDDPHADHFRLADLEPSEQVD
jgi:hypothetical protein